MGWDLELNEGVEFWYIKYCCPCWQEHLRSTLSNFKAYNIVLLTRVIILYMGASGNFLPYNYVFHFSCSPALASTILSFVSKKFAFLKKIPHVFDTIQYFLSLSSLFHLAQCPSGSFMLWKQIFLNTWLFSVLLFFYVAVSL